MKLRTALAWSLLLHTAGFGFYFTREWVPPAQALNMVDLVVEPIVVPAQPPNPKPVLPASTDKTSSSGISQSAVPLVPKSESLPPKPAPKKELLPVLPKSPPPPSVRPQEPPPRPTLAPEIKTPSAPEGTVSLPEGDLVQLQYKEEIREHLRHFLKYPEFLVQGTVRLTLALSADGKVKKVHILETSDPRLATAALGGIYQAQPYPALPNAMKLKETQYEFLVQYRPE